MSHSKLILGSENLSLFPWLRNELFCFPEYWIQLTWFWTDLVLILDMIDPARMNMSLYYIESIFLLNVLWRCRHFLYHNVVSNFQISNRCLGRNVLSTAIGNSSALLQIIDVYDQSLLEPYNRWYSPNALGQKDILVLSSMVYNLLQSVHNNIVVILKGNRHLQYNTLSMVQGCCLQKANRFYIYNNNKYRYHENTIINKSLLLLVGIADCFAARACSFHCRNNVTSL